MSVDDKTLKLPSSSHNASSPFPTILKLGICVAMCYMGILSRQPYDDASLIRSTNRQLEKQVMDLKIKNQQLRNQAATINTETSMKNQLRENNYIKPDEVPLIVYMK